MCKNANGVLCLMSRTDYDKLSEQKKEEIKPYYDAFQDALIDSRMITSEDGSTIEILLHNVLVEGTGMMLWHGVHDLVSPGNEAYVEFHNFDDKGNTINIEKYVIDTIVLSVVKGPAVMQTIKLTGCISGELTMLAPQAKNR
jgi:hypothetical protein